MAAMRSHRAACAAALAVIAALAAAAGAAEPPPGSRVLVLLDSLDARPSYSKFLGGLEARGYALDARAAGDPALRLREWDDWLYGKVVLLGGRADLGGALDAAALLEFLDAGGDVVLALDGGAAGADARELAAALGAEPEPAGTAVIDHFSFHAALGAADRTAVLAAQPADADATYGGAPGAAVLYRGVGLGVPRDSALAFAALPAPPTAYSGAPGEPAAAAPAAAGAGLTLVALVQQRNGARAAVAGSLELFGDAFAAANPANAAFAAAVAGWAFHERGVLRLAALRHRIVARPGRSDERWDGVPDPPGYRVGDTVELSVDVEACAGPPRARACAPAALADLQAEFVMLDPYVRLALAPVPGSPNGTHRGRATLPDKYGVFKWVVDHRRRGASALRAEAAVPVRPLRHDEFERFIAAAAPYYAAAVGAGAGFLALGLAFLWSAEPLARPPAAAAGGS